MDKEKQLYESPQTKMTSVKLESGICATSGDFHNPDSDYGKIEEHQVNQDFNFGSSFQTQDWDEISTGTGNN